MSTSKVVTQLLDLADIKINGDRPQDMTVHNHDVYSRLLKEASLGLGEAYMDGWWDSQSVDNMVYHMLKADLKKKVKGDAKLALITLMSRLFNLQSRARSVQVADTHYNLDNTLYNYMLGRTMSYTCAYFKGTEDLDTAQDQKHDLICRKLGIKKGDRVLEMGCGWGGFAEYATKHYDCELVSINISKEQVAYAKERCKELPVTFHLCDYRDKQIFNPRGELFDKAVSIGMCEHIGYKNYRQWLQIVSESLKPDGLFLLHTIGGNISTTTCEPWTRKYIFPNGMLPSIQQLGSAIENIFVMEDWHNFGAYYDKTLMAWHQNFVTHWDKLKDRYNQRFYRMWVYYLLSCAGMFRARDAGLWQIVLSKDGIAGGYESVR